MASHLGHCVQQLVVTFAKGLDIPGNRPEVVVRGSALKVEAPGPDVLN